jgi:hypothetical protein
MLTSAVGPTDVSADRSTVTGQQSMVKGSEADRWGPQSSREKGKEKEKGKARLGSGPKGGWAGSRLIQARLGFIGQLGLRLSRPVGPWAGWACRPARLNRPAHNPPLSPSLSLSLCDKMGPGGSAPCFPRHAGPSCRSHSRSSVAARSGVAGSGVCARV